MKLHESFHRISKEGVDLQRMSMIIDRAERQVLLSLRRPLASC